MKRDENKNLKSFAEHLDEQYGIRGTEEREKFEEGFEAFKLGVMLQELRKETGLTQEQLAEKCGTTKNYTDLKVKLWHSVQIINFAA